jgi:hypothetical protein
MCSIRLRLSPSQTLALMQWCNTSLLPVAAVAVELLVVLAVLAAIKQRQDLRYLQPATQSQLALAALRV